MITRTFLGGGGGGGVYVYVNRAALLKIKLVDEEAVIDEVQKEKNLNENLRSSQTIVISWLTLQG